MIDVIRQVYRRFVHMPWLDKVIYYILDAVTGVYARLASFSFPDNYIRAWKLNMLWGKYEPETYALFQKIIAPGMTIVDIGAHIGYFTRLFSKLVGRRGIVYALEADPENFSLLKKNTAGLYNVKLLRIAASDRTGTINFYRSEKTGCHSTVQDPLQHKETVTVSATDLDSLILRKENVQKVDLIKMDIEGGEIKALHGMQNILQSNTNLQLIIEFNPGCLKQAATSPTEFIVLLAGLGFKIFAIHKNRLIAISPSEKNPEQYLLPGATFVNLYCSKNPNPALIR